MLAYENTLNTKGCFVWGGISHSQHCKGLIFLVYFSNKHRINLSELDKKWAKKKNRDRP